MLQTFVIQTIMFQTMVVETIMCHALFSNQWHVLQAARIPATMNYWMFQTSMFQTIMLQTNMMVLTIGADPW